MNPFTWDPRRQAALAIHLLVALIPFGASTAAAFTVWSELFDSGWAAAVIICTLEVLAILSLIMHIARLPWPMKGLRHAIPFLSILPLGYELHKALAGNAAWIALPVSIGLTGWAVYLSFTLFRSLERLFISNIDAAIEATQQRLRGMVTTLAEWNTMSTALEDFADVVRQHSSAPTQTVGIRTVEPTPLLIADTSSPKLREIAALALLKDDRGDWVHTPTAIREQVRVDANVVNIVTRLLRQGHITTGEGL